MTVIINFGKYGRSLFSWHASLASSWWHNTSLVLTCNCNYTRYKFSCTWSWWPVKRMLGLRWNRRVPGTICALPAPHCVTDRRGTVIVHRLKLTDKTDKTTTIEWYRTKQNEQYEDKMGRESSSLFSPNILWMTDRDSINQGDPDPATRLSKLCQ